MVSFSIHSQTNWIKGFSLDVAAEIIGILLVIFSIDLVIDAEREKERQKLEKVALQQLRRPLLRHFGLLINLFKTTVKVKENNDYKGIADLFDDFYFEQLAILDFSQPAPVIKSVEMSWLDYLLWECQQFRESLNRTVEKYSSFLQPDVINLIEEIINSPFIWWVVQSPKSYQLEKTSATPKNSEKNGLNGQVNLLARPEVRQLIKEHTMAFVGLVELYNEKVSLENQIKMTEELWTVSLVPQSEIKSI
ncbi:MULTISPECIES: hypothetical protein [unclassified Coleofasciculus]|uniref:hypothetical protein n=1 Tax=unclassified Coleofasciculus TaxID=2692782 RepID=UPI001882F212|nr:MULTISPECIES: hypothetical protein [unclassified Coleofasciculus]MBE9129847.1 hypothetical protein [Coleofasciculus sp. LEGE 07081]MBE9152295.1 hypothetical protein [Coleofasciculus sp. LEGE 07092]